MHWTLRQKGLMRQNGKTKAQLHARLDAECECHFAGGGTPIRPWVLNETQKINSVRRILSQASSIWVKNK